MTLRLLLPVLLLGACGNQPSYPETDVSNALARVDSGNGVHVYADRACWIVVAEAPAYHDGHGVIELTDTGNCITPGKRYVIITGALDSIPTGSFPPNTRQALVRGRWVNIPGTFNDRDALVQILARAYPELFEATEKELTAGLAKVPHGRTATVRKRTPAMP